jgi:hypothetical protein
VADDDDGQEDAQVQLRRSDLVALREKAREHDRLVEEHGRLEREVAFSKANLGLSERQFDFFSKGYSGELSPEAIRAEAEGLGLIAPPAGNLPPVEETEAHLRMAEASGGANATLGPGWEEVVGSAQTVEEVMAAAQKAGHPTSWSRVSDY